MRSLRRALQIGISLGFLGLALSFGACQGAPATRGGESQPPPAAVRTPTLTPRQAEMQNLLERRAKVSFVPGEIIAKRRAELAPSAVAASRGQIKTLGFTEERTTSGGEVVLRLSPSIGTTMTRGAVTDRTIQAIGALRESGQYDYVQPNYLLRITALPPNDSRFPEQWHYSVQAPGGIRLPNTWAKNIGSLSVVVAVIDTGILPNHPDIAGSPNLAAGYDMISDTFRAKDGNGRDSDPTDPGDANAPGECDGDPGSPNSWHGTHVSGTIGVVKTNNGEGVAGVNWQVKVQAVRVLGRCGGSLVDINDGIRWAAGLPVPGVPNNPTPAKIINMSLGGPLPCSESPSTQAAINDAVAAGTSVVVAAGNEAADASGFLPAGCNNVIAVAASDYRGYLVTRYSNFGTVVDVMAPGGDVQRDDNNDNNPDGVLSTVEGGYEWYNGTSMAAPHVTGVAALLLAADPSLTPAQVEAQIKSSARPRSPAQCPHPCGAGLLTAPDGSGTGSLALSLSPSDLSLKTGDSAPLTASVIEGGSPVSGETVTFTSSGTSIASVDPPSAVTDGQGRATTTVRGLSRGSTSVRAQARTETAEAPVRVPSLSTLGALAMAAFLLLILRRL